MIFWLDVLVRFGPLIDSFGPGIVFRKAPHPFWGG
jgi:hypothetical protein